jgi:ribbon-helix-helix CopG family protein
MHALDRLSPRERPVQADRGLALRWSLTANLHAEPLGQLGAMARPAERALTSRRASKLTYVNCNIKSAHMEKTQICLRKEELDALRKAAARSGRSVADLVREAIRKVVLKPQAAGPVVIWDGTPKRPSFEHDSVHDEP